MSAERNHIKVFVSSTVYDFETDLRRIFATLDGFGYDDITREFVNLSIAVPQMMYSQKMNISRSLIMVHRKLQRRLIYPQ